MTVKGILGRLVAARTAVTKRSRAACQKGNWPESEQLPSTDDMLRFGGETIRRISPTTLVIETAMSRIEVTSSEPIHTRYVET